VPGLPGHRPNETLLPIIEAAPLAKSAAISNSCESTSYIQQVRLWISEIAILAAILITYKAILARRRIHCAGLPQGTLDHENTFYI